MILYFCKLACNHIFKKDPNDIAVIMSKLNEGKDYHEIAIELCGRDAIQGFLFMLAACYIHETYLLKAVK